MTRDLPRRFRSRWLRAARFVAQRWLLKPIVWLTTRVTVEGREHVDALRTRFIAVANHSSHLDAPLIVGALPWRRMSRLAVGAAADYFFDVKWRMWLTVLFFNVYPVDRTGGAKRPELSQALLADENPLLLFPEGGRSRNGEGIRTFKTGAAALAILTEAPILPIGLVDAQKAMPRGRSWPVRGRERVAVRIGEPLRRLPGENARDFTRRIEDAVCALSGMPRAARNTRTLAAAAEPTPHRPEGGGELS